MRYLSVLPLKEKPTAEPLNRPVHLIGGMEMKISATVLVALALVFLFCTNPCSAQGEKAPLTLQKVKPGNLSGVISEHDL